MLEFRQVTGSSDQHEMQSGSTATPMSVRASLYPPAPGCLCSQRSTSRPASPTALHVDGFEPQADVVVRPSALHVAERIFKKLVKLRKKAALCSRYASCFPLDEPCREDAVTELAGRRTHSLDSVDTARGGCGYDSDEHSAGFVSVGTPTSSSSSSSFDSVATSHSAPHSRKPGSQMMAKMLLSLLNHDVGFSLDEADDEADSGDESEECRFGGPRESAWHQPEDEILSEQDWRMMRYGHLHRSSKPAMAAIPAPSKHHSSSKQPSLHIVPHHSSTALGSKRESKHM